MRDGNVDTISESGSGMKKRNMSRAILLLLFGIFICSFSGLIRYCLEYREMGRDQEEAVKNYTQEVQTSEKPLEKTKKADDKTVREDAFCPIKVDFDALSAENKDIAGWLYCEGTNINYPVMQGKDNDYYLNHAYDGKESRAGALFVDAENSRDFADSNTIIYGHHMRNGSMFAHLADFGEQEYFDTHPVMWLLTPEKNYRVELLGGYLTSADSDCYTIFTGPCEELEEYLKAAAAASDVQAETETPKDGRYVMLSTCEYDFEGARYVLHGRLLP